MDPLVEPAVVDPLRWRAEREKAYNRMARDQYIGYLDHEIRGLLEDIFSIEGYYPTSSCSGRIIAIDSPYPWRRRDSYLVMKKHSEISGNEVKKLAETPVITTLWLIASGPIIHIMARTPGHAMRLLRIAREAGFKHSGLLASSKRGYLVELVTGIWVAIPIKIQSIVLIDLNRAEEVAGIANRSLAEGRQRLEALRRSIEKLKKIYSQDRLEPSLS